MFLVCNLKRGQAAWLLPFSNYKPLNTSFGQFFILILVTLGKMKHVFISKDSKVSLYYICFNLLTKILFTFSAKNFGRISQLEVNIKEDGNRFRTDFQRFIGTLASSQSERRDQVEMNIMRG